MANFCPSCGQAIDRDSKFCVNCGIEINSSKSLIGSQALPSNPVLNELPDKIRENLKNYSKHLQLTCLECGYVGLMGISKVDQSQKNKWGIWVLCAIGFLLGSSFGALGIITGLLFGALGGIAIGMSDKDKIKAHVVCPNCMKELVVK
jgi:hypothetical protein